MIHVYVGDALDAFPIDMEEGKWDLVHGGEWSESPMHSGHCIYFMRTDQDGLRLVKEVHMNYHALSIDEETYEEGPLNDDQLQALHGYPSLEAAQEASWETLTAVVAGIPEEMPAEEAAAFVFSMLPQRVVSPFDEVTHTGLLNGDIPSIAPGGRYEPFTVLWTVMSTG